MLHLQKFCCFAHSTMNSTRRSTSSTHQTLQVVVEGFHSIVIAEINASPQESAA